MAAIQVHQGGLWLAAVTLAHDALKKVDRICSNGLCNRNKLGHVDLALIALDHPHNGVRTFELRCQIALRETGLLACCRDDLGNGLSGRTSQCFQGCAPIS